MNNGSTTNCYNTGAVSAKYYAGGIAGVNSGSISNCYNAGTITATSEKSSVYAGGIAGYSTGSMKNVFHVGKVSAMTNAADGYAYIGGLAGYTKGGTISYGYNIGEITAPESNHYTGKVVGNNEGAVFSRLYYIGTNADWGIGNERYSKDKVEFKSEAQMKQQATYVGFDFNTVWSIAADKNGGYPVLQGMPAPEDVPVNPSEPGETSAAIDITEKSYGSATGTYHLTVTVHNQGDKPLTGTVFVSAYDGNHLVSNRMYSVSALAPDGSQTISAELTTNGKVEQLKAFCWNMTSLRPLSDTAVTEG